MNGDPLPYDLFDMAANDQSLYYLGQIFGNMGEVLAPGIGAPKILSAMFEILNGVALTVGVLVVTYTTVVGLFMTASEGEFLGKKWSGLWVPIRTVIGIVGLFPSSGGYCALQVVLMWVILQGVSAADVVWSTALDVISGQYTNENTMMDATAEVKAQMNNIFRGMICQETLLVGQDNIKLQTPVGEDKNLFENIKYYCKNNEGSDFCTRFPMFTWAIGGEQSYVTKDFRRYNFGPVVTKNAGGACGYLEYANPDEVCKNNPPTPTKPINFPCMSAMAQYQFLATHIFNMFEPMYQLAGSFVRLDYAYSYFNEKGKDITKDEWDNPSNNFKDFGVIKKYCSTPVDDGGLGLSSAMNECCTAASCPAYKKGFRFNSDLSDRTPLGSGLMNPSTEVVNAIFIPFWLGPSSTFIDSITNLYVKQVLQEPFDAASKYATNDKTWIDDAKALGWLMAGGYYVQVAKNVRTSGGEGAPELVVSLFSTPKNIMNYPYRTNLSSSAALLGSIENANMSTSPVNTIAPTQSGSTKAAMRDSSNMIDKIIKQMTENKKDPDPIASIARMGYQMMRTVEALFFIYAGIVGILGGLTGIAFIGFGTGLVSTPAYYALNQIMTFFGPLALFILVSLYTAGALLGIYVPLIPYIIYTVTAVGWFIGVIEAMVAAPFVALGIMSPGGQHEILSRAEPSLMIIFNLFLRPTLMVFGMIAAMLLSWAVVRMVNAAYGQLVWTIIPGGKPSLMMQIIFIVAYTALIITIISKCYSLIHMLPERTLTYIGGHAIQYGEEQALGAIKGGIEGATAQMAKTGRLAALATTKLSAKTKKGQLKGDQAGAGGGGGGGGGGDGQDGGG